MSTPYKVGDIVKLIAGGPDMAIEKQEINHRGEILSSYRCQWFAGKKLEHGSFPHDSLELVPKK
ncbi:YodC family protein [Yersinia enterocolitica]|uniref:YodC family protein n=1 Tax=Yersinia enterocolitica TaxID=630 RepID=UPI003AB6F9BB